MADEFFDDSVISPSVNFSAITPSDTAYLTSIPKAIYVGVGGNVVAVNASDVAVTLKNIPDGTVLPIRPTRINATSTTATDIVGLY